MKNKAATIFIIAILCASLVGVFLPKVAADQLSLQDNFTADSSLNTSLWQVNGPVGSQVGIHLSDISNTLVTPALTFSSTNGMGISGVASSYQSAIIQSVQSFSTPFTLAANVMGASPSYAVAFLLGISSADESHGVVIDGNLAPSSGYLGIWYQTPSGVNSWTGYQGPIISNPSIDVLYQVSISVDASGLATLSISSQGRMLGTNSVQVGTGNYYAILGQREGAPYQTGPNQAYWQSVSLSSGSISSGATFQLQVSPQSQTVGLTGDTYYDVSIEPLNGFSSSVTLTIDNAATLSLYGVDVSAPSTLYPNVYYSIKVVVNDNPLVLGLLAKSNSYVTQIDITASAAGVNEPQSLTLTLTITKMIGVKNEISISGLMIESSQGSMPLNLAQCFTLQQNFYITPNGVDKSYWVQNVLIVGEDSSGTMWALPIYEIWSSTWTLGIYDMGNAQELAGDFSPRNWLYAGDSVTSHTELTLTSSISSNGLLSLSSNWGSTGIYQLPQGSYIANLSLSLGRPQLDVVGPPSVTNPDGSVKVAGQTSFGQPTSGSVWSSVQLGLSGTPWYSSVSQTTVTPASAPLPFTSPSQTGEISQNLAWTLTPRENGDYETFSFSSGAADQGVSYNLGTILTQETTVASLLGGSASVDETSITGVNLIISDSLASDSTSIAVTSANYGSVNPGLPPVNLENAVYYDVNVRGISDGTAAISITDVPGQITMQYWNGAQWISASGITVSGNIIAGNIPVADLTGTPIALGAQQIFVTPEYPLGAILALFACFAAFLAFAAYKKA